MIKDKQKLLNRIHLILDLIISAGCYILAWYIRIGHGSKAFGYNGPGVLPASVYMMALYYVIPAQFVVFNALQMYKAQGYSSIWRDIYAVIRANVLSVILFLMVLFMVNQPDFSRSMIFIYYVFNIVAMIAYRIFVRSFLKYIRKHGLNNRAVLLVGYSRTAEEFITCVSQNPQWGFVVTGILDDEVPAGTEYKGVKVLGKINNLDTILPENNLSEIIITLALSQYDRLESIVSTCEKSGVHTKFIADYQGIIPTHPYTEYVNDMAVVNIRRVPLNDFVNKVIKRSMDIVGAIVAIIVFSPVMIISAIIIAAQKDGPVLFTQERVGRDNQTFKMYKFRTMRTQTVEEEKKGWTTKDDPRVTKFGRFLRSTSLDETPQFFNILRGDMSLIGPRPERPQFVEEYKEKIPRYMIKHQVRPGLTGWAQVNGFRGDTSIRRRIEYDIYYIENWTFWMDVKIIILTFFKGFINNNAY